MKHDRDAITFGNREFLANTLGEHTTHAPFWKGSYRLVGASDNSIAVENHIEPLVIRIIEWGFLL